MRMLVENATPNRQSVLADEALAPPGGRLHRRRDAVETAPKPLAQLKRGECRFCVADAPEGEMDRALFCAAASPAASYCPAHRRRCLIAPRQTPDQLAAEIEAHLARR